MLHLFLRKRFATGTASPSLLVPFLAKNSRLGYFFNARNLFFLREKKVPGYFFCLQTFHLFLRKRFTTGIASLALLIPLFAKNSHLGYFFNANNLKIYRGCRDSFATKRFNFFLNLQSKFN